MTQDSLTKENSSAIWLRDFNDGLDMAFAGPSGRSFFRWEGGKNSYSSKTGGNELIRINRWRSVLYRSDLESCWNISDDRLSGTGPGGEVLQVTGPKMFSSNAKVFINLDGKPACVLRGTCLSDVGPDHFHFGLRSYSFSGRISNDVKPSYLMPVILYYHQMFDYGRASA